MRNLVPIFLREWEESRHVIGKFDDKLHELKEYGFSFVTAFLTASTILFEKWIVPPGQDSVGEVFPETVKAAILIVTLFLILGLHILDRNYCGIQKAVLTRLVVLENLLNFEISESIEERFRKGWIKGFITNVYILFIVGIEILGYVVLSNTFWILHVLGLLVIVFIIIISVDFVLERFGYGYVDWILDKTEVEKGDEVHLIITNLGKREFPNEEFPMVGKEIWRLTNECVKRTDDQTKANKFYKDEPKILKTGIFPSDHKIEYRKNYIWNINTGDLDKGVYYIYRAVLERNCEMKDKMVVLARKLIIIK